jgi:hypothetical protein
VLLLNFVRKVGVVSALVANRPDSVPRVEVETLINRDGLHPAAKDFFEPLGTNNPRTDFYRRESTDFVRHHANKYCPNPTNSAGGSLMTKKINARDSGGGSDDNDNRVMAAAPG